MKLIKHTMMHDVSHLSNPQLKVDAICNNLVLHVVCVCKMQVKFLN